MVYIITSISTYEMLKIYKEIVLWVRCFFAHTTMRSIPGIPYIPSSFTEVFPEIRAEDFSPSNEKIIKNLKKWYR